MRSRILTAASPFILVAAIAGCSSPAASVAPASVAPVSQAPVSVAPASVAPASVFPASVAPASVAPASAATSGATVEAKSVGTIGTVLVAGSNGLTVYNFMQDVKDSNKSACTGGCAATWPALTVAAGATPVGGTGVTGKLGTITRDDGTLQVTYNGLPLYLFMNDKAPGDANGVYTGWVAVKP
jgi:predicted lipoprotein with Yx(FWY)xxD motif